MISASNMDTLMPQLVKLASTAGQRIMAIYDSNELEVEFKADKSPLTLADRASHEELLAGLSELQCGPVLSEEGEALSWQQRSSWQQYWLIDPLDGTKEFIKRNGEFTVNIALIQNHQPVAGVVYAPAMYLGFPKDLKKAIYAALEKVDFISVRDGWTRFMINHGKSILI